MNDIDHTESETAAQEKKRGRPKGGSCVLFRENGRVKAWSPRLKARVNVPSTLPTAKVYDGLGCDWAVWTEERTREGFYNAARRSPFRPAPPRRRDTGKGDIDALVAAYPRTLCDLLGRIERLSAGLPPEDSRPLVLEGSYWVRFLADVFLPEAGAEGLSRANRVPVAGKVWASVNVLPPQGNGFNYSDEPWYAVLNASRPPLFAVRVSGSEYVAKGSGESAFAEEWPPERLAAAVLLSLEGVRALDSCAADAMDGDGKPETAQESPALASVPVGTCQDKAPEAEAPAGPLNAVSEGPEAAPVEAGEEKAEPVAETVAVPAAKTWGGYLAKEFPTKGLTTSKPLGKPVALGRILEMVTDHAVTKELTARCREFIDKKDRNAYKRDNLHVWYPSAVYKAREKGSGSDNLAGFTGLACLDFDGFETAGEAEATRDDLFMSFPEVLFAAVSASGLGVFALVALDFDGTEDGYRCALEAAFQLFESRGYMPDTGCSDPTRARYVSADPEALSRPDGYTVKPVSASGDGYIVLPATMLRDRWTNGGRRRKSAGQEYLREALSRIASAGDGMKDTTMTSVMGTAARLIRNYGLNAEKVYASIRQAGRDAGYDERKTEDKIRRFGVGNGKEGAV